jgi:hypothetical protein
MDKFRVEDPMKAIAKSRYTRIKTAQIAQISPLVAAQEVVVAGYAARALPRLSAAFDRTSF